MKRIGAGVRVLRYPGDAAAPRCSKAAARGTKMSQAIDSDETSEIA